MNQKPEEDIVSLEKSNGNQQHTILSKITDNRVNGSFLTILFTVYSNYGLKIS